jgi:hypothetical protein
MIVFLIISIMAGAVLGLRFEVLILFPAMLLAAALTIASGVASGHASGVIVFAMFGTLVSLQFGYFGGSVLQERLRIRTPREDAIEVVSGSLDINY